MNKIKILDKKIISKIAAGEVIERPANVLKELIENSIDSGADQILIDIKNGGISQIIVKDNGPGMSKEDAQKSILRHATSKINKIDDLFNISTMGFRGEALYSISAISKFKLYTKKKSDLYGTVLFFENDNVKTTQQNNYHDGTIITVKDIFYNVVVRKRFLKTSNTEYNYCLNTVYSFVIGNPNITWKFIHNDKEIIHAPKLSNINDNLSQDQIMQERIKNILKNKKNVKFTYFYDKNDYAQIKGIISAPNCAISNTKHIYLYVNNRWIKDKSIISAIIRGFQSYLVNGKYPISILKIYSDPNLIDVNVHPSKLQVRFQYMIEIQNLIVKSIKSAIRSSSWLSFANHSQTDIKIENDSKLINYDKNYNFIEKTKSYDIKNDMNKLNFENNKFSSNIKVFNDLEKFNYMGSLKGYIFYEYLNQILIVDQHAFHERILYEKILNNKTILTKTHAILIVEKINLEIDQIEILNKNKNLLKKFGFEFNFFKNHIEVIKIPNLLKEIDLNDIIVKIIKDLKKYKEIVIYENIFHKIAAHIACHGAIKIGQILTQEQLNDLIKKSNNTNFYNSCPHGRNVFKLIDLKEISKWFNR